jgi:hypothetical protein
VFVWDLFSCGVKHTMNMYLFLFLVISKMYLSWYGVSQA